MFNVTVINIKESAKHIAILLIILIMIFAITKMLPKIKTNEITTKSLLILLNIFSSPYRFVNIYISYNISFLI